MFPFPVEVTIGFSQEVYIMTEDGGIVALRVAVLEGELGISVWVNISLISGTAIGKLLCSSSAMFRSTVILYTTLVRKATQSRLSVLLHRS